MFDSFKSFFGVTETATPVIDSRTAVAALLVRAAKTDQNYTYDEVRTIDRNLARHYGLNVIEAMKLRAKGEVLERQQNETSTLIGVVRDALQPEECFDILSHVWQVILVDDDRRAEDAALVAITSHGLGISRDDAQIAREYAQATL